MSKKTNVKPMTNAEALKEVSSLEKRLRVLRKIIAPENSVPESEIKALIKMAKNIQKTKDKATGSFVIRGTFTEVSEIDYLPCFNAEDIEDEISTGLVVKIDEIEGLSISKKEIRYLEQGLEEDFSSSNIKYDTAKNLTNMALPFYQAIKETADKYGVSKDSLAKMLQNKI